MSGTPITNNTAQVVDHSANETICDRSGFRLRKGDSIMDTWDGYKTLPRMGERSRHPQDFIRAKQYDHEGATSIRPRQDDRLFNSYAWNALTNNWDRGSGGVADVTADDL